MYTLNFNDLGPQDDLIARKETGFPISRLVGEDTFGADSVLALIWMARRKAGERKLRYRDVLRQFPTFADIEDLEIEAEEEDDEEEGETHPLPSGAA